MHLTDLDPRWLRIGYDLQSHRRDPELTPAIAQGIAFLCPACFRRYGNGGGTHTVMIWFEGRAVEKDREPTTRWSVNGTGFSDLSLRPSIDLSSMADCCWHGFVSAGVIVDA